MGNLEELARNKFADLSEAEIRVVQAAPEGNNADCRNLGGGDDPAKADTWPEARIVRADLIRWLCVEFHRCWRSTTARRRNQWANGGGARVAGSIKSR